MYRLLMVLAEGCVKP